METKTMSGETMQKITGNVSDEAGDATYRVAATLFVSSLEGEVTKATGLKIGEPFREALIGFALAAVLELLPTTNVSDLRKRLAYNLRVRSYEVVGDFLVSEVLEKVKPLMKRIEEEGDRAARLAERGLLSAADKPEVPPGKEEKRGK
jgi:hypothetical protein